MLIKSPITWISAPVLIAVGVCTTSLFTTWREVDGVTPPHREMTIPMELLEMHHLPLVIIKDSQGNHGTAIAQILATNIENSANQPVKATNYFEANQADIFVSTGYRTKQKFDSVGSVHRGDTSAVSPSTFIPVRSRSSTKSFVAVFPTSASVTFFPANAALSIPAAFGNPAVLGNPSESQVAQIAQIANDFTTTVQSSGVSSASSEYKRIWDTAAFRADEAFRGKFGVPAFNAMQISRGYQP